MALQTLKKRADFLRIRGGQRVATRAFVVEAKPRRADASGAAPAKPADATPLTPSGPGRSRPREQPTGQTQDRQTRAGQPQPLPPHGARFGFTVTKKLGGAVTRNRIKRRLREAVRAASEAVPLDGRDVVIVARSDALTMPYSELVAGLTRAFDDIAAGRTAPKRDHRRRGQSRRAQS